MVNMVAFDKCLARPGDGKATYLLTDHLRDVASRSSRHLESIEEKMLYLAGLAHDVGKAHVNWQDYIRKVEAGQKNLQGVPHSPFGAAIYALFGEILLKEDGVDLYRDVKIIQLWFRGILDIADHHGELKDMDRDRLPWTSIRYQVDEAWGLIDWNGWLDFIAKEWRPFESFRNWNGQDFKHWEREFERKWAKAVVRLQSQRNNWEFHIEEATPYSFRRNTGRLIFADRMDAGAAAFDSTITNGDITSAFNQFQVHLEELKEKRQNAELRKLRESVRSQALAMYSECSNSGLFLLNVPTGLGKTMAAVRVALEALRSQRKKRIIYAAPYLSIITQVVDELWMMTGLETLEHHSLTWVPKEQEDVEQLEDKAAQISDTWQGKVVVTSFHQLYRALFPKRAQHCSRIPALEDAILIIDEPQIMDNNYWRAFLWQLKSAMKIMNMQTILVSATMPPYEEVFGSNESTQLITPFSKELAPVRYRVIVHEDAWDERRLSQAIFESGDAEVSAAAILNTVKDASLTYQLVKKLIPNAYYLSGMMTPLHKKSVLNKVKMALASTDLDPTILVSTQVIEAGVDLSFGKLFRSNAILPSILQAAGRLNRHAIDDLGELNIFRFLREGKLDTRKYVYKDSEVLKMGDELLNEVHDEYELNEAVKAFYIRLAQFARTGAEEILADAASGHWNAVAGLTPFKDDRHQVSVFVPFGDELISDSIRARMNKFGCYEIEEIYEKYVEPGYVSGMDYIGKKQFMGLMQLFLVSISPKMAFNHVRIPDRENLSIWELANLEYYDLDLGFHVEPDSDAYVEW